MEAEQRGAGWTVPNFDELDEILEGFAYCCDGQDVKYFLQRVLPVFRRLDHLALFALAGMLLQRRLEVEATITATLAYAKRTQGEPSAASTHLDAERTLYDLTSRLPPEYSDMPF